MLGQGPKRTCGCFIPESVQAGWGFEQPSVLKDITVHGRWTKWFF